MDKKIIDLYKYGNLTIPIYLLKNRDKFKLDLDQFVFLMYLYNNGDKALFDPSKISEELNLSVKEVMNYINVLTEKKCIRVAVEKNEKGILEDRIDLSDFYQKASLIMIDNLNKEDLKTESDIFSFIEKEFGRTLSPMESEIIKSWLENGNSEEIVKEAVKEATFNGVSNLRYIDKILFEWEKKGIKTKQDVEKNKENHRKKEKEETPEEIFDYNWFDDDEE